MNLPHDKLKEAYLHIAISEYEFSWAPEYDRKHMTSRASKIGTLDFDYGNPMSDVEICRDGAWVNARVWIPKKWLGK